MYIVAKSRIKQNFWSKPQIFRVESGIKTLHLSRPVVFFFLLKDYCSLLTTLATFLWNTQIISYNSQFVINLVKKDTHLTRLKTVNIVTFVCPPGDKCARLVSTKWRPEDTPKYGLNSLIATIVFFLSCKFRYPLITHEVTKQQNKIRNE